MAEFFSYLSWFKVFLLMVALMSGILSIIREWALIHGSNKVDEKRLFWGCVRIAFVISSIALWGLEHSTVVDLNKRLDALTKPQFSTDELQVIVGEVPNGSVATFVIRLNNSGAASAIAEDTWRMSATVKGVERSGDMLMLSPTETDRCIQGFGVRRFVPSDALYERASHPITTNDYRLGVLVAQFIGVSKAELLADSTHINLSAADVNRNKYIWDISAANVKTLHNAIALPSLAYPIPISKADCPISAGGTK
jgi:hypothetical protein